MAQPVDFESATMNFRALALAVSGVTFRDATLVKTTQLEDGQESNDWIDENGNRDEMLQDHNDVPGLVLCDDLAAGGNAGVSERRVLLAKGDVLQNGGAERVQLVAPLLHAPRNTLAGSNLGRQFRVGEEQLREDALLLRAVRDVSVNLAGVSFRNDHTGIFIGSSHRLRRRGLPF